MKALNQLFELFDISKETFLYFSPKMKEGLFGNRLKTGFELKILSNTP